MHIIIFTRALGGEATGVCTRERKRKYRKGEEDAQRKTRTESERKRKKDGGKGRKRRWSKRNNRSLIYSVI